ncbi:MAG TPA: hypothetical protein VI934_04085 [Candidatus Nanoarchaeia archaeon]|nr:hypothetical protein [Candidatus Nanoarchaeia archaeon]
MIIPEGELEKYLGNRLNALIIACLEGRIKKETLLRITAFTMHTQREYFLPVLDYFLLSQQIGNRGMKPLAMEPGISYQTLIKIFDLCQLPRLTREDYQSRLQKNHEPAGETALWERKEYRGLSDYGYNLAFFVRITSQQFLNEPFTSSDVREFLGKKSHEDGRNHQQFYYSQTFNRWANVLPPLKMLYHKGVLERRVISESEYPSRTIKSFTYRYVSDSLAELGVGKS